MEAMNWRDMAGVDKLVNKRQKVSAAALWQRTLAQQSHSAAADSSADSATAAAPKTEHVDPVAIAPHEAGPSTAEPARQPSQTLMTEADAENEIASSAALPTRHMKPADSSAPRVCAFAYACTMRISCVLVSWRASDGFVRACLRASMRPFVRVSESNVCSAEDAATDDHSAWHRGRRERRN
jgi:hypothetical protein